MISSSWKQACTSVVLAFNILAPFSPMAQTVTVTGSVKPMPDAWIDADTRHEVIRLTRIAGSNASFYFHNDPFIGNKMVFYHTDPSSGKQIYTVDLDNLS